MRSDALAALCLSLPGATVSVQWGESDVYKVGGKVFAIASPAPAEATASCSFKASQLAFELLLEQGIGTRAPYLPRGGWVYVADSYALTDDEFAAYIRASHTLVAKGLTRTARRELGIEA